MKLNGRELVTISETDHASRVFFRRGKFVTENPEGLESVRYLDRKRKHRFLPILEAFK